SLELLGGLHAWAPEQVGAARSAQALYEAGKRRLARGDQRGFVEDLLQAAQVDPGYAPSANRLARHLADEGRVHAADEIWRDCAAHNANRNAQLAAELHEQRLRQALGASHLPLAFSAALDANAHQRLEADSLLSAAAIAQSGAGQAP